MGMPLRDLVALIESKLSAAVDENGEINEAAFAEIAQLQDVTFAEKADAYCAIVRRENAAAKALKAELAALREADEKKVGVHEHKAERLKSLLFDAMKRLGIEKAGNEFHASIGSRESVDAPDPGIVPDCFVKITRAPMKKEIADFLSALTEEQRKSIPWAALKESEFLSIR